MRSFKDIDKLNEELSKYKRTCKCGHTVYITNNCKSDYTICSWCGKRIYKNKETEERYKFKENLLKEIKNV